MPALKNQNHETACQQYILNGGDQSAAFRIAYPHSLTWKDKTVWSKASTLFSTEKVQERVRELQETVAKIAQDKFNVDAQYVLGRHLEIDQMDLLDILQDDGSLKPVREWPKVWRSFISGMDVAELFEGRGDERVMVGLLKKIKWPDKIKNLELLGKHISVNAYREQVGISGPTGENLKIVFRGVKSDGRRSSN